MHFTNKIDLEVELKSSKFIFASWVVSGLLEVPRLRVEWYVSAWFINLFRTAWPLRCWRPDHLRSSEPPPQYFYRKKETYRKTISYWSKANALLLQIHPFIRFGRFQSRISLAIRETIMCYTYIVNGTYKNFCWNKTENLVTKVFYLVFVRTKCVSWTCNFVICMTNIRS